MLIDIIVLGAGVKPSGKPSWMLEDRIIVGEQLYNVNAAPKAFNVRRPRQREL